MNGVRIAGIIALAYWSDRRLNELTPEEIDPVSRVAEQLRAGRLFMKNWPTV
jgi:hypothetical protein